MLPILKFVKEHNGCSIETITENMALQFKLTEEEKNRPKPSGGQTLFRNRTGWARFDLKKAGLLTHEHNQHNITDDGIAVLGKNLESINRKFLLTLPTYAEFMQKMKEKRKEKLEDVEEDLQVSNKTPEDLIVDGHNFIRRNIESELLEKIANNSPDFFEKLVLKLIKEMGYGADHSLLGRSGDGGVDGVIREDKLGLDEIYLQAKRWKNSVTVHQVRDFAGALQSKKSKKGIFITTSEFTGDANDFVKNIENKIILINGEKLASLMYEYDIGVKTQDTYVIKKIEEDYFSDE